MTKPLRAAVEIILSSLKTPKKVLEIGSRQAINQNELANVRNLLSGSMFVGVDMQAGPGVDVIASANKLPFPDSYFDLVLCLETLEHADKPWLVCSEIERVLNSRGVAIVSSQQNFPIHKHPSDYFRYTPFGLKSLFPMLRSQIIFSISPPFDDEVRLNPQHVVLVGTKRNDKTLLKKIRIMLRKNLDKISVHKPYSHRWLDGVRLMKRALSEFVFRQEIEFF